MNFNFKDLIQLLKLRVIEYVQIVPVSKYFQYHLSNSKIMYLLIPSFKSLHQVI